MERAVREKKEVTTKETVQITAPEDVLPVISGIVEKTSNSSISNPGGHPDGFPKPIKLEGLSTAGPKRKGKSLFKQRMEAKRGVKQKEHVMEVESTIVNDPRIDQENAKRLAALTEAEIEAERKELLAKLDPRPVQNFTE